MTKYAVFFVLKMRNNGNGHQKKFFLLKKTFGLPFLNASAYLQNLFRTHQLTYLQNLKSFLNASAYLQKFSQTCQLTCKGFLERVSLLAKVFWNGSAYLQKFSGTGQLTCKGWSGPPAGTRSC
jgi:hypothetical protein